MVLPCSGQFEPRSPPFFSDLPDQQLGSQLQGGIGSFYHPRNSTISSTEHSRFLRYCLHLRMSSGHLVADNQQI